MKYTRAKALINKFIDKYGGPVKIKYQVDEQLDLTDGSRRYSDLTTVVQAIVKPFSTAYIDDNVIQKGDREVYIADGDIAYPNIDDDIEILGQDYRIINIQDVTPDGATTIIYKLQARVFAPTIPVDVLRVPIGSLETGTLVVDPRDFMGIRWRVVGQGHHSINTTTLVTEKVRDEARFGAYEIGIGENQPWGQSYLRSYLRNTFVDENLSYELKEILQTVPIVTQGVTLNENISIASLTELFDTDAPGGSSGNYISYFSSDARRIGRTYTDNTVDSYWTRDLYEFDAGSGQAYAVDTDGTSVIASDDSTRGIKPMIFLNKGVDTFLNDNGYYELIYD